MNKMKYWLAVAAVAPLSLLAEEIESGGEATSTTVETLAEDLTGSIQTQMTGLLDMVAPVVVTIVVAGLAIWGGIALVGVMKRAFQAGKGR